jgi:hypothetical protein
VKRGTTPQGTWRYVAVLLDARGRTMEVELNDRDGEVLYALMQRLKANPLLERVYRRIAMPIFDQLLKAADRTSQEKVPPSN